MSKFMDRLIIVPTAFCNLSRARWNMVTPRKLYFRNVLNENFHERAFLIIKEEYARTKWIAIGVHSGPDFSTPIFFFSLFNKMLVSIKQSSKTLKFCKYTLKVTGFNYILLLEKHFSAVVSGVFIIKIHYRVFVFSAVLSGINGQTTFRTDNTKQNSIKSIVYINILQALPRMHVNWIAH